LKIYRSPREVLPEIRRKLAANHPRSRHSPLDEVTDLLCRGRHYTWTGIYLATGTSAAQQLLGARREPHPGQIARPETKSKILVSLTLAGRERGVLDVESDRANAFGVEDRVLLEGVADELARFLSGPGRYIVRRARRGH
jgi:hypothetical protein